MSKYNSHFANEDRLVVSKASRELYEKRRKMLSEFNLWKSRIMERYNGERDERLALRNGNYINVLKVFVFILCLIWVLQVFKIRNLFTVARFWLYLVWISLFFLLAPYKFTSRDPRLLMHISVKRGHFLGL